jgi:hypothetical protein
MGGHKAAPASERRLTRAKRLAPTRVEPAPLEPPTPRSPLVDDRLRAEALLHDVALALRHQPVIGRWRALQLRALDLKRDLSRWCASTTAESRQATVDAIAALDADVRARGLES